MGALYRILHWVIAESVIEESRVGLVRYDSSLRFAITRNTYYGGFTNIPYAAPYGACMI